MRRQASLAACRGSRATCIKPSKSSRSRSRRWTSRTLLLQSWCSRFAASHNLGLSVFGTGHEFNDRNSGLEPNSLLIRTTCLYSAEVELAAHNRHGHEDGFLRLGAGFTWGTSKFGLPGAHQLARDSGRTVVSGHAGNVGVVSRHVARDG